MISLRYLRFLFLVFLFFVISIGRTNAKVSEDSDFDWGRIESRIKSLLPDSLEKVDSLSCLLIDHNDLSDSIKAMGWYYRAEAAYYSSRFDCSGDYYEQSLDLFDSITNPGRKAVIFNNLGLTRYFNERYNDAFEAYLKSAEYEKQTGNDYGFAQCLHNMALVQDKAGRVKSAVTYFDHALNLFFEMDSMTSAAAVCNDYAIHLSGRNRNEDAIEKYEEALKIFEVLGDEEGMAKVKCNIGALHLYEKDYQQSALFLEEALNYFQETDDPTYLINIYSLFGDLYFELDRTALSVIFYERAENTARRMGWNDLRQKNLYSLFKALKAEKEYVKAIEVLETYSHLKDSLIIANKAYLGESVDNQIETELMENELNLFRAKVREKNLSLIILGLLFVLGIVAWLLYGRSKLLKNEKERQRLQNKVTRMQANPHFIYNALSSVQSYILKESKDEALDYLSDIALCMRKIFDVSEFDLISIEEDIDLQNRYLKVQCRRYYGDINCGVNLRIVSGSKFLKIPPLLLRPLIDDLFESGKIRDCKCLGIIILYEQKNNELEISMESNGVVVTDEIASGSFKIIEERLSLLNKNYKSGKSQIEQVDIINDGIITGTRIKLYLPLIDK
jgi:tetratricopeptide (TPR) repeat protein